MSCKHGNHVDYCELCDVENELWRKYAKERYECDALRARVAELEAVCAKQKAAIGDVIRESNVLRVRDEKQTARLAELERQLCAAPVPAAQVSDYWLDGKVIRKGKEYVAEIVCQEPLLLRELLTGKAAAQAEVKVPEVMAQPTGSLDHMAQTFANGWNACRDAMLAAKAKGGGK